MDRFPDRRAERSHQRQAQQLASARLQRLCEKSGVEDEEKQRLADSLHRFFRQGIPPDAAMASVACQLDPMGRLVKITSADAYRADGSQYEIADIEGVVMGRDTWIGRDGDFVIALVVGNDERQVVIDALSSDYELGPRPQKDAPGLDCPVIPPKNN
ncbi:hypothetical protein HY441_00595 [Candidatus Microgenomates bacterium]|nr:hypothetical protein [Candidatus Microgenomates bacterium]